MAFSIIHFLRSFSHAQQINPVGQHHLGPSGLTTELEGSRKFSLNSLMALYPILAIYGPKALQPVVLTLLTHTISLRLATNTCFLHDHPTLSRFLHVTPLLGTFCMACIALVSDVQSPALAAVYLFLGIFPLVTIIIHKGILCTEAPAATVLPVQVQRAPAPAVSGSADTTVVAH